MSRCRHVYGPWAACRRLRHHPGDHGPRLTLGDLWAILAGRSPRSAGLP